jgi:hypothetical protein
MRRYDIGPAHAQAAFSAVVVPDCRDNGKFGIHNHAACGTNAGVLVFNIVIRIPG